MRFPLIKRITLLLVATSCVSIAWAQSVYWSPSSGTLQQGKSNAIDLFFDSCQPEGEPELSKIDGLELRFRGQSSSTNIINGRRSSKVILNYQAIPLRLGTVTLPSIRVQTSDGEMQVPAARFEVVEATVGNSGVSPEDVFVSIFQNRDDKIYSGEVFELEYIGGAKEEYQLADLSVPEWNPTEIVSGGLVDSQASRVTYKGAPYIIKLYTAKAIATSPGIKQLPPATQEATVVIGRRRNIFQEAVYDSFTIQSEPFALEILPLPEGAPATFKGAVGNFELESRVVPEEVQVGEPVTWTLELKGTGNWPAGIGVPARSVSSRFKAIQPETNKEFGEDDLFTGSQSEDIVLIPTEAGSFEFGPLEYTYFDPKDESYKTISIPSKTVTVTPATPQNPVLTSNPNESDPGSVENYSAGGETYDLDPSGQNTFQKPPQLLKDPKGTATAAAAPQKSKSLLVPTTVALASPLAAWFALALIRSLVIDPRKAERKALSDLRKTSRASPPADLQLLKQHHLKWRNAASRYFALDTLEPTPLEIFNRAKHLRNEEFAKKWKESWELSDQLLFGKNAVDSSQWQELQMQAVGMCPGKNYSPASVFRKAAWLPVIALAAIATSFSPDCAAQDDTDASAAELYQQGNFAAAAEKWSAAVASHPEIYEHRYNAGLAYAQTGDWSRAWGFWTSAFCLDPSRDEVAWNLRIAHQNTSAYDPILQSLIAGEGLYGIVRLRSPAGWQTLSVQALWVLGILLFLAILSLYVKPLRCFPPYFLVLSLLSGLFAYFAQWSHLKYESLGEPDSILVIAESPLLSIPTDLQSEQVSTTVGEGTIVKEERTFLGWVKIQLPNGESGWLRNENLMPLYGRPSQG
ncbi:BatD family protein [Pelagicoccus sp. SDUM812002]|uniref:BatD family protein n=1 Tax=Pelagicoccus sp. SDUM812002 TaxID=3041266 RepID=UPI00280F5739|nr:BatD family protein [Pelagicoccus sp. SDUM812002]MDQ8187547.1 BatD family protein [Pelagicoccus sp. SDUM812002]